jgi:pilus assembly protein CpaD
MQARAIFPMIVALMLAACAGPQEAAMAPDQPPTPTPHVDRVRVELSTAFAPASTELPPGEATRLETFLDQAEVRPNDIAFVATRPGDPLAQARIGRIKSLLAMRGVGVQQVAPPSSGVAFDHVVLTVDRYVATAPACPDWSGSPATPHTNTPSSNFGCATATDFALMLDNPRDLVMGRTLAPADSLPAIDAVQRYHAGKVKPLLGGSSSSSSSQSGAAGASAAPPASGQ